MNAELEQIRKRQGTGTANDEAEKREDKIKFISSISENPMFTSNLTDLQSLMTELDEQSISKGKIINDMEKY